MYFKSQQNLQHELLCPLPWNIVHCVLLKQEMSTSRELDQGQLRLRQLKPIKIREFASS